MDVRIGISQVPREIEVELPDGTKPEDLMSKLEAALGKENGVVWLSDKRGRQVGIPAAKLAYIEVDTATESRRVGFGAAV